MTRHSAFGDALEDDDRVAPEKHEKLCTADEIAATLDGYKALDQTTGGRYGAFLRAAARCETCGNDVGIESRRRPIPLLCGTGGLDGNHAAYDKAHAALHAFRRPNLSLRVDVENPEGVRELRTFLDGHGLPGLSIGHCGWGDLTARIRGAQLGDGVDLLILGADWYPLTQCTRFLIDRYSELDTTLSRFVRKLGLEMDVPTFFRSRKVYLGNTLLCYRAGWDRTGTKNLSRRSFDNCRPHLARHIDALAPKVIVTFGCEAARSVAHLLEGDTAIDQDALASMRRDPMLSKIMSKRYAHGDARGIAARRDQMSMRFVPLYHPSMSNSNKYAGDYEALRNLLGEAQLAH